MINGVVEFVGIINYVERGEGEREMVDWLVERRAAYTELCEGGREVIDWLVKFSKQLQFGERWGEVVYAVVEAVSSEKGGEGGRERINRLIKSNYKIGEEWRQVVQWLIKIDIFQ